MGQGYFAGASAITTTNNRGGRGGVMGVSEGARCDDVVGLEVGQGINLGDGDLFFFGEAREQVGGSSGEQGFAGAWWARD